MTRIAACMATVVLASMFTPSIAAAQRDNTALYDRPRYDVSARYVRDTLTPRLPRDLVNHQNHPADPFLVGSPGSTVLDRIEINSVQVEVGTTRPFGYSNLAFLASYTAQIPVSFDGRVERQQANDNRAPASASFVYATLREVAIAQLFNAGLGVAARLSAGENIWLETRGLLSVGRSNLTLEKGWSRFSSDQAAITSEASGFEMTPRLVVAIRNARISADATLAFRRIRLRHEAAGLEDHTASGLSLGFGGRFAF